jgi:flagellar hook-associated protein 3 FlgL
MMGSLNTNMNKLLDIQQQLASQRKYPTASKNPYAVTKGMGLETKMTETQQYISNLQDAVSWLKFTDDALLNINDIYNRINELAIYAGDGVLESVDSEAIGAELRQLKEALMSFANSTIGGEYLFSGLMTDTVPFSVGANGKVQYNGNNYALFWEFSQRETGKVSITGRELFPLNETTNSLKGIEVPIDFEWKGRGEILEFNVGWQTVKVRIPERWEDEIRDGVADASDYDRYRDPGEALDGYSLDEIANLINSSTEMGDVSRLLKATVVKDLDKGVQYLQIQSLTGEPVNLTGWPETDPVSLAEGIKGSAYGPIGRIAAADGGLTLRFTDNSVYMVDIAKGESLEDVADKLNGLQDGRVWAAYKTDGVSEWLDIVGRSPGDSYSLEATGGATSIFAPEIVSVASVKRGAEQVTVSNNFMPSGDPNEFISLSGGVISIRIGNALHELNFGAGATVNDIVTAITTAAIPGISAGVNAGGALEIISNNGSEFSVTASGGLVPLYSDGVSVATADSSGNFSLETGALPMDFELQPGVKGAFEFEYNGKKYWIDVTGATDLDSVAAVLQTALQAIDPNLTVSVKSNLDADANQSQWLLIEGAGSAFRLSGFGGAADVIGSYILGSEDISMNSDHTHIGLAALLGLETALKSTEFPLDFSPWDTTASGGAVHLNFASGTRRAEVFIGDDSDLTLEELASRINSVCGDWLEAVVETDGPDGTNSLLDPLNNSGDNREDATKRLVLRTKDGEPFAVYDGLGKSGQTAGAYASMLGVNTALSIRNDPVTYPSDGTGVFDENMPATLEVTVGDRVFQVKVCRNNRYNGKLVAEAIRDQVNEQYGGVLISLGENVSQNADPNTYSVYAVTGEPLRVVDKGYGDPRFTEYTGGVALQLGIAAGVSASASLTDATTLSAGVMRISTPGRTVDVPVLAGETLKDVANRIRDYAGSWLDVSFWDSNIEAAGGSVGLSIAARDGSAVSVVDIQGGVAKSIGLDTGLTGTNDLSAFNFGSIDQDSTLSITVNGATHTIDLWDSQQSPGRPAVNSAEEMAELINVRFQGLDIRAQVIDNSGDKRLVLWSPKGYNFEVSGTGSINNIADALGFGAGNNANNAHGLGNTPFNQVVTARTGNNRYDTDFFGVLDNLINTAEGGNVDGISDVLIPQLDSWMSTLLKTRAQTGALVSRYNATVDRLTSNNTNYEELHSQTVAIEFDKTVTDYAMAQAIYQASLAVMAQIIQPTLLDFLR